MDEDVKTGGEEKKPNLPDTDAAFRRLTANRTEETYRDLIQVFVFEVMATQRTAGFPTSAEAINAMVDGKPLQTIIMRDQENRPCLVFLTESASVGNSECTVSIEASKMFVSAMKDPVLYGVALNPWDVGGACFPKELLFAEMMQLSERFGIDDEHEVGNGQG